MSKANGPATEGHKTTPYYTTAKSRSSQTNADVSRSSSLKFTDSHDRPNYGTKSGGTRRGGGNPSGYPVGGQGSASVAGSKKSGLPTKFTK